MKKQFLLFILFIAPVVFAYAQAPQAIPYQAVARNTFGSLISNQNISLRFSIRDASATGTIVYRETQSATTNALGLFSVNIGQGNPVSGTFGSINWGNGAKYTQAELDSAGGSNYTDMGTQQLMSVPYAQYANNGMPSGSVPGNMLYWNGSQWLTVAPGITGQSLYYCNGVPHWGPCLPTITTTAISSVTFTSAFSGGNVSNDGGSFVSNRGLCWNTSPNPTTANFVTVNSSGTGTGSFINFAGNLTPGTTYYLRAFATNAAGTAYGNEVSFTTLSSTVPTISLQGIFNVTHYSGTASASVTSNGGQSVIEQGVCWSTSPNPTLANMYEPDFFLYPFNFTINLYGIIPGTTYYVRAYATNSAGTAYSNQVQFTSLALTAPVLTTTGMSGITSTTANSGGNITSDGGSFITSRGICYSTSPNPTTANSTVSSGIGSGSFTSNMTGLTLNTLYYVRAYATNAQGTSYGNQVSFTSSPFVLGQSYGGGIICYIDGNNGQHGLIAAPTDGPNSGSIHWYNGFPPLAATATGYGSGASNTTALFNALGGSSVAGLCQNYTSGGFTDWFLPSKDELVIMLQNNAVIGNISPGAYWSSSQVTQAIVWACGNTGSPFQVQQFGITIYFYRPVRSF